MRRTRAPHVPPLRFGLCEREVFILLETSFPRIELDGLWESDVGIWTLGNGAVLMLTC